MFEYIRVVLPPITGTTMEQFLMTMKKAQILILTFAVEVPQYVTSPSHSSVSSSPPPGGGSSHSMTATMNLSDITMLSFTDQALSVAWGPY